MVASPEKAFTYIVRFLLGVNHCQQTTFSKQKSSRLIFLFQNHTCPPVDMHPKMGEELLLHPQEIYLSPTDSSSVELVSGMDAAHTKVYLEDPFPKRSTCHIVE